MSTFDTYVLVVVVRPAHSGSLCRTRTLGRMGVQLYGVGKVPDSAGMISRYGRGKFITNPDASADKVVEFLRGASRQIGQRPILTCTNDISSTFIADNSDALRDSFLFPNISRELVHALCDKKQMYFLCKKLGIPTAETSFPQSRQDVIDFLAGGSVQFPVMLQGIDGASLERRRTPRTVILRNPEGVLRKYDEIDDPSKPTLMLQEYIPGGDDSVWMFNG